MKRLAKVVKEIECSHCGAPLQFEPGEIVATCKYCGYTSVIETGEAFTFEHSLIPNKLISAQVDEALFSWMHRSFVAPKDLARKSRILDRELVYLPFWIIQITAESEVKGIFERLGPPQSRTTTIRNRYDWLVLARRNTDFPTREYKVPLEGKIPFDFTKIESLAKLLNSELSASDALSQAQEEIKRLQAQLATDRIDKIDSFDSKFEVEGSSYLHSPAWFMTYEYRNSRFKVILDGVTGEPIRGDLPASDFKIL